MSGVAGRAGPTWERTVADYAAGRYGLPWDRAPLRGTRDLLDLQGCLPAGFLVGCKAIRRVKSADEWINEQNPRRILTTEEWLREQDPRQILHGAYRAGQKATFGAKISGAMDQCDRALVNIGRPASRDGNGRLLVDCGGIVPVQVMQRSGYPAGKAYVVTELDYFLNLAVRRQKWRDDE